MTRVTGAIVGVLALIAPLGAQTPQPFPRPGATQQPPPPPPATTPTATPPPAPAPAAGTPAQAVTAPSVPAGDAMEPNAASLGLPLPPSVQFLASYEAGMGQRYYIFGSASPFTEVVQFYRTQLKEKGDIVFEQPPTHIFQVGRFRSETMAFPAGVTVKDWTWAGSPGYPNPKLNGQPARFATTLMIVPVPPVTPR